MFHRLAADALLVLHLGFILAVVLGGLLVLRWPRLAWIHLPVMLWGFIVELAGWVCPLTPLEQRLRVAAGDSGYGGGFIDHYIVSLIYPDGMSTGLRLFYAGVVAAVNIAIYWVLLRRQKRSGPARAD